MNLEETIRTITPASQAMMARVWKVWDNKCIPLRSLGKLQSMIVKLAGIQNRIMPEIHKKAVIVMAADNGIIEEGVTQSDNHVTTTVTCNMTKANATICVLSGVAGADVFPVDVGIKDDFDCPGVRDYKVMHGTNNMTKGPAMTVLP